MTLVLNGGWAFFWRVKQPQNRGQTGSRYRDIMLFGILAWAPRLVNEEPCRFGCFGVGFFVYACFTI